MMHCSVTSSPAVEALGDCEPANGEATHSCHCQCFDVFHTVLCLHVLVSRHDNCVLPGQVANRLGCAWETGYQPEMGELKLEMKRAKYEMDNPPLRLTDFGL